MVSRDRCARCLVFGVCCVGRQRKLEGVYPLSVEEVLFGTVERFGDIGCVTWRPVTEIYQCDGSVGPGDARAVVIGTHEYSV